MSGQQPMESSGRQQPHVLSTQGFAPSHASVDNPEDFYRTNSAHPSEVEQNQYHASSVSPANSETPIVKWTHQQQAEHIPPGISEYPEHNAFPSYDYPPHREYDGYRPSMDNGIVNGEIGSGPVNTEIGGRISRSSGEELGARQPITPLSAGFKTPVVHSEEEGLKKLDEKVARDNRRDVAIKLKIRLVKVLLRSVNCACSIVVLSLLASTFQIVNATRHLAPRNGFTPWSVIGPRWPQITLLVISSISLLLSLSIMYGYWKGGHAKAQKAAFHATLLAGCTCVFSIVMWGIGIGIMQGSRNSNSQQDIWGWSCKEGLRKQLFLDVINYPLVCRQNNWVTVCGIIEIVVETFTIGVYIFAFYRLHSKERLRKSMHMRDQHRSNIWLNKLKEQQLAEQEEDHETTKNTLLNSQGVFMHDSGARAVPILQPPPPGHHHQATRDVTDQKSDEIVSQPPPAVIDNRESRVPATPRSVSFGIAAH